MFEIVAVMDFPEEYSRDPRAIDYIVRIANSGARAGKYAPIEFRDDTEQPSDLSLDKFTNFEKIDCRNLGFKPDDPPPKWVDGLLVERGKNAPQPVVGGWDQVMRPTRFFAVSSRFNVETKLGEGLVFWLGEDTRKTPCTHAILAGQIGWGKSSLLHVLVTGLAARYSPQELRVLLVDGKVGVEFQVYQHLPHADVVCLNTSPAVALSVLVEFREEMIARYKLFEKEGVKDLIGYRQTGKTLPRKIMIVDEYGVLLKADPAKAGECLGGLLSKGRAAGTHLVLSSQRFDEPLMPAGFEQHIQLLASLFLSSDELQRSMFEREGKRMIRGLTARGQVVINDRSGRDEANTSGAVAMLEPSHDTRTAVARIVEEIVTALPGSESPVVLNGDECATLASNPLIRRWSARPPDAVELQEVARLRLREGGLGMPAWSIGDKPIPIWLGRKFDVRGHALAVLRRAPFHNLLSIGSETVFRLLMVANALAGLRSMLPMEDFEILLLDGLDEGLPGAGLIREGLEVVEAAGARVTRLGRNDAIGPPLEAFLAAGANANAAPNSRLVVVSEPEYLSELHGGGNYGTASPGAPRVFKDILKTGPQSGAHVIVTASSLGAFSTILHPTRDRALFQHRVVQ